MYCKLMHFYLKRMKVDTSTRSFKNSLDMDLNQCGALHASPARNLLPQGKSKTRNEAYNFASTHAPLQELEACEIRT